MSIARNIIAAAGISLIIGSMSSAAFAATKRTEMAAESDVQQLLRMMDKDKNGTVSKDEFMQYMSEVFDRLDINANRELEAGELRPMTSPNWLRCDALAIQRGVLATERRSSEAGPSPWKQFMDSCLAGKVR